MAKFALLHPDAKLPRYAYPGDAGADLFAVEEAFIGPGCWRAIKTGLAVELEPGTAMLICPRSGLARDCGVTVLNAPGVIDSGYRGEIAVVLHNVNQLPVIVKPGDAIAQALFINVRREETTLADTLSETERNARGFGSSG